MEERQNLIKDISIVRQSSIKIALEFCKVHGIQPSMKELIRLTDIFAEDALLTPDKQFKESVKKIDEWVVSKKNI
jgi:hypothetical protein